ncbi:slo-interacting protein 1 isoform X2 [Drosophila busckii]|uniref:slo-interacting protein 1 isoform X2 n=1 Tax=Drosophila busckii TaxID=30019 RepID=UPI00083EE94A|nr:slo-interacting protein 1 isoform X2 [Drosophila busckii]
MCSNNSIGAVELDYVVLKLNGSDITSLSNYEVVQMFLQANETLVVELSRKTSIVTKPNESHTKDDVILQCQGQSQQETAETCETQTVENYSMPNQDIVRTIADHIIEQEHNIFEQCLEPEIDIEEVTLHKTDAANNEIGLSVSCNGFFIKSSSDEGVRTAAYNDNCETDLAPEDQLTEADVDADAEVFISDIQPNSIADKDGRLRRGDQILRINGIDVKTKEHAERKIAENKMDVTLLVSRLIYPADEFSDGDGDNDVDSELDNLNDDIDSNFEYTNGFLNDDYINVVDKLDKLILSQEQDIQIKPINGLLTEVVANSAKPIPEALKVVHCKTSVNTIAEKTPSVDHLKTSACHTKSQFEATDANLSQGRGLLLKQPKEKSLLNTKNVAHLTASTKSNQFAYDENEHIYETIPEDSESEPLYCSPYQSSNYMTTVGSCSSTATTAETNVEMQQQSQRVAQWLGIKSHLNPTSPKAVQILSGKLNFYNNKQQRIFNRVSTLRSAVTNTSGSSSSGAGYNGFATLNLEKGANQNICINFSEEVDNSSSAYNTGGSNNSASPRQNLRSVDTENVATSIGNQVASSSITSPINSIMMPFGKTSRIPTCSQPNGPLNDISAHNKVIDEQNQFAKTDCNSIRQKSTEEPQSQCPQFNAPNLSSYHFVSSQQVAKKSEVELKQNSFVVTTKNASEEIPMVWKVKRRPDGTRYIVKRPVRNRIQMGSIRKSLRSNEITTTEDDTISEVKIGRYWTKEERKRHIERARERRHHQMQQQQLLHHYHHQQQQK